MKQSLQNKTVYLVRHGLATYGPEGYGDRKMTAGLLPEGVRQAEAAARYLKAVPHSLNLTSEVPRCRETAAAIAEVTGKKFVADSRLNEFNKETFAEFTARLRKFLDYLTTVSESSVIICTHSAVIAGICGLATSGSFKYQPEYDDPKEGEIVIMKKGICTTVAL